VLCDPATGAVGNFAGIGPAVELNLFRVPCAVTKELTMPPIGRGQSELWQGDRYLCTVDYEVTSLQAWVHTLNIRLVKFNLYHFACIAQLEQSELCLRLADGTQYLLPRPLFYAQGTYIQCCATLVA
jgi:hypothetical protein